MCGLSIHVGQERLAVESLNEVLSAVYEKRWKWKNIGLNLGITIDTLNVIEHDHRNCNDCLIAVLEEWLKRSEPRPTWDALQQALNSPLVVPGDQAQLP